ncbi:MAG: hypothetical protein J7L66_03565 [Anaerolineaceae bacterium]|nr:hypothetical protein [Anaerolineaceae bacterium]
MIDFFASITIALIIAMTLVIYFSNRRQARILGQMRLVLEDWYQAKMRDRRETFRKKFKVADGKIWLGEQVQLTIIEQGRKLENPRAVEFFSAEGPRLVISPLRKRKLKSHLRASEGKRGKVTKLVEPLLGHKPRKVQVIERSVKTAHEWFDLEIEAALANLKINWGELSALYFYLVPQVAENQKVNQISKRFSSAADWVRLKLAEIFSWLKQKLSKVSG